MVHRNCLVFVPPHADRKLGGWFYTMARHNIGTVAGGAWVWDNSAHLPWEVLYSANYSALELPAEADLRDIELPTGVSIRVKEPTLSYRLGYNDPGLFSADLVFAAEMAHALLCQPARLSASRLTSIRSVMSPEQSSCMVSRLTSTVGR